MAILPSEVRYRIDQIQLQAMRDALDELEDGLQASKRSMEKLHDLRAELRLQSANKRQD